MEGQKKGLQESKTQGNPSVEGIVHPVRHSDRGPADLESRFSDGIWSK